MRLAVAGLLAIAGPLAGCGAATRVSVKEGEELEGKAFRREIRAAYEKEEQLHCGKGHVRLQVDGPNEITESCPPANELAAAIKWQCSPGKVTTVSATRTNVHVKCMDP